MDSKQNVIAKIQILEARVASQILELQRLSYRVEADLIGSDAIPGLQETLEQLQNCNETFYGFFEAQILCGAISFKLEHHTLDIHRLVVHPDHFRKGVAKSLLEFVLNLELKAERCVVQTGALNLPAIGLYQKLGFLELEQREVIPGLWVSVFEKVTADQNRILNRILAPILEF
jgi:ribosomal protein S18 acetylase RimI-like enzyme